MDSDIFAESFKDHRLFKPVDNPRSPIPFASASLNISASSIPQGPSTSSFMLPSSAVPVVADVVSSLRIDTRLPQPFYMNAKSVNFGNTAADSGGRDVLT